MDHGIRVVGINPVNVETNRVIERYEKAAEKKWNDRSRWRELHGEVAKTLPFSRFARPEEVADLAVFLSSPRASYISGTIVTIDGGHSFRPWMPS